MDPEEADNFAITVNQILAMSSCFCDNCTDFLSRLIFDQDKQQAIPTPMETNEYYWKCDKRYYMQEVF